MVPEGKEAPQDAEGRIIIRQPVKNVYLAASSAMDMFSASGCLDSVRYTSTKREDWSIEAVSGAMDSGSLEYIGKYNAPDYERLLENGCGLAIESTMVYHSPKVRDELLELGIPVLVERSSYESDPLGRLEWIRLYGILMGKEEEADRFYEKECEKVRSLDTSAAGHPGVAFFSVSDHGYATIRKPGDYVSRMIELAGGSYVPQEERPQEDNALSTMNIQMEKLYSEAKDADILIYNSTIQQEINTIGELLERAELLGDFKAVSDERVWCTNKDMFQHSTAVCDIILELNAIITDEAAEEDMRFFHRVK